MPDLADLQRVLGVFFKDVSKLEQALVHSSYVNENPGLAPASNERLEYLGDAVLGLVIAEKLYLDFPDLNEGEMTRLRASLVRKETLAWIAETIKLGEYLFVGRGEEGGGGRHKPANLASALEAVIAAVFLDSGLDKARECILILFRPELDRAFSRGKSAPEGDYKSELQHFAQSRHQEPPVYELVNAIGPAHGRTFTVDVRLGNEVVGQGSGRTKKAAEADAARAALEKLFRMF